MKKYFIQIQLYALLLPALSFSCATGMAQVKIIQKRGSNQFQNVHCGLQDKTGNLWFGTTGEGVYRYDGKSFTTLQLKTG